MGANDAAITPTPTVEREALAICISCFCLSFILMSAGANRKIWFQSSLGSREASGIAPRVRRRFVSALTVRPMNGITFTPRRAAAR